MSSLRKCTGSLFQRRGPVATKLLPPNMLCVHGTAHDLSVDERSYSTALFERTTYALLHTSDVYSRCLFFRYL